MAYKVTALIDGRRYWLKITGKLTTHDYDGWRYESLTEAIQTAKTIGCKHASVIDSDTDAVVWNELDTLYGAPWVKI